MNRFISIVSLLALLVSRASAQAPHIDHLTIDDPTGRLTIFGSFGSALGTVTIDSVETQSTMWTPDSIICTLPDLGRGSCGPVIVTSSNGSSPARLLSEFYLQHLTKFGGHPPSDISSILEGHLQFRADILLLFGSKKDTPKELRSTSSSKLLSMYQDSGRYSRHDTTTFGSQPVIIDVRTMLIQVGPYTIGGGNGPFIVEFPLTPQFQPADDRPLYPIFDCCRTYPGGTIGYERTAEQPSAFIPPDSVLKTYEAVSSELTPQAKGFEIFVTSAQNIRMTFAPIQHPRSLRIADALGKILASYPIPAGTSELNSNLSMSPGIDFAEMDGKIAKFVILR